MESPGKVKNIKKYLGRGYEVVASVGHVRDLPKSKLGVDLENNFEPQYINIRKQSKTIKMLKEEAKKSKAVYLATDPDREGEAISWHLAQLLDLPLEAENRVTFNEITHTGVENGMEHPRKLDMDLVDAQQARRVLDRIVGYKLSPLLWKKIRSGLSAGRVQSVVVSLIVDRENEIRNFVPQEYWSIEADLTSLTDSALAEAKRLVDAQQARRVLDRIVGYKLSPLLWKKIRSGLSAGRVQSVVVSLIVDRENEIRSFIPQEYWSIEANLTSLTDSALAEAKRTFVAKFYGKNGKKIDLKKKEDTDLVLEAIKGNDFVVDSIKKGTRKKSPVPPVHAGSAGALRGDGSAGIRLYGFDHLYEDRLPAYF